MTETVELILACPHCKLPIRQWYPGDEPQQPEGVFWTDGKQSVAAQPFSPRLVRCENCQHLYWKRDASCIGSCEPGSDDPLHQPQSWEHVWIRDTLPSLEDHLQALELQLSVTAADECYVRTQIWWALNDMVRESRERSFAPQYQRLFVENLQRLGALYENFEQQVQRQIERGKEIFIAADSRNPSNTALVAVQNPEALVQDCRLHRAEIARELGDFEQALGCLDDPSCQATAEAKEIRKLAQKKNARVHRYSFSMHEPKGTAGEPGGQALSNRIAAQSPHTVWDDFLGFFR